MAYDIKRLPSEASVDHDHEASLHDIKRLPSEASVDHDHEASLHDIKISGITKSFYNNGEMRQVLRPVDILIPHGKFVSIIGPSGCGKSTLFNIVAGLLPPGQALITRRPFYAPHHTVTQAALIGGGSGIPRPGMVSLAHRGVLFLDELPEFRKNVLDGMRQPMEERKVQIARSAGMVTYPSDFILVAAMNPCPCGYYPDRNKCRCTQPQIEKYLGKISGPILDRIDLCVELHPVDILHLQKTKTEKSSEDMKRQIRHARERQAERFAGTDCRFNGDIRSAQVEEYCPLGEEGQKVMEQLYRTLQLSARVYHRILKTARTIADLEDREEITGEHLLEAACYRPSETYWN